MWSDDDGPYDGRHYHLAETINSPPPLRRPTIMIGGQGEKKTLRLLAKYGDACNIFANDRGGPAPLQHKLDVLAEHCSREGTDYDRIRKTILWSSEIDPATGGAGFVEQMKGFAAIGVDEVHVMHLGHDPVGFVRGLGDFVLPGLGSV
jgi:alkanesulfonate monooxygenase SsuD/methylene tetrahydromethanopterin reductase-like flavin-dependent oxidoreductase (luciferase family)